MDTLGKALDKVLVNMIEKLKSPEGSFPLDLKSEFIWLSYRTISNSYTAKKVWEGLNSYSLNVKYNNIASGLLKALKKAAPTTWKLILSYCEQCNNPDVQAYIDYLLMRPRTAFKITEVKHINATPEVAHTLKQFPLARMAVAKRVIALMLRDIWRGVTTEITYKNRLRFALGGLRGEGLLETMYTKSEDHLTYHPISHDEAVKFLVRYSVQEQPQMHAKEGEPKGGGGLEKQKNDTVAAQDLFSINLPLLKGFGHYHEKRRDENEGDDFYECDARQAIFVAHQGQLKRIERPFGKTTEQPAKAFGPLDINYLNLPINTRVTNLLPESLGPSDEENNKAVKVPPDQEPMSKKCLLMTQINCSFKLQQKKDIVQRMSQQEKKLASAPNLPSLEVFHRYHFINSASFILNEEPPMTESAPGIIQRDESVLSSWTIKSFLNVEEILCHDELQSKRLVDHFMKEDNLIVETSVSLKNLICSDDWDIGFEWSGIEASLDIQCFYILSCYLCASTEAGPDEQVKKKLQHYEDDSAVLNMMDYLHLHSWPWEG
jgi:hypothetical protein